MKRSDLIAGPYVGFNTNRYPILKLADAFYLVNWPSSGQPSTRLHKIHGDRIEQLDAGASDTILRAAGLEGVYLENDELDRVSEKNGWRRFNQWSSILRYGPGRVDSIRHGIRLNFVKVDLAETLTVESLGDGDRWSKTLLTVNTSRHRSYSGPPPLDAR